MHNEERITYFAETDARNRRTAFGIKAKDRTKHVYVIGKTGMGKSTLLENMAIQDIQNGEGMAFLDPHGKSADLLLEYVPKERIKDIIYFAPFDTEYPISFNVMEDVGMDKRHLVVSGLISAFKKIWGPDTWSARMEYILTNTILALLEYPDSTLLGINKMYTDKEFRKKVVENISDPSVRSFWVDEYAKYTDRFAAEATPAIQNKIGQFTTNPIIRNIIGQAKSSFDFRKAMDEGKVIIINLSKGRVGEVNANLLGSLLITKIYLAAMSRADVPERVLHKLPNFYLYVDEFQSFANESFKDILSEARKYKLNLTIAHQYVEQMEEEVRSAVFGNVGTMIVFRVGAYDSELLEKEFAPIFVAADLVNLGIYQIYLKLMIDGVSSAPFSATTLPPIKKQEETFVPQIIAASREAYAKLRATVEEQVRILHGFQSKVEKLMESEAAKEPDGKALAEKNGRTEEQRFPGSEDRRRGGDRRTSDRAYSPSSHQHPRERRENGGFEQNGQIQKEKLDKSKNPFQAIRFERSDDGPIVAVKEEGERDVLSLSNLAKNQPKEKNGKAPSTENVSALRDVLSSILKKNGQSEKAEHKDSAETLEARAESHAESARKAEPARSEESDDNSQKDRTEGAKKSEQRTRSHADREVPEEVLKKVLSMEDNA